MATHRGAPEHFSPLQRADNRYVSQTPADLNLSDNAAEPDSTSPVADANDDMWRSVTDDPTLSRPPADGAAGNVPPGEDLRLDIGWDRFEKLMLAVVRARLGVHQVRFRRYGVAGQK